MTHTPVPVIIEKEIIEALYFPDSEVVLSEQGLDTRNMQLYRAAQLSTTDHQIPVKILFEDFEGLKQSDVVIWAVTSKRVILKHGATIPIQRIHEIKI